MSTPRPRLRETEYNYLQNKRLTDQKTWTVLLKSDEHGWLTDLGVQRCINKVLQANQFDQVALLGDLGDWPYISRHEKKLYGDGTLNGYSEIEEARYIREQILAPLRHSTKAQISFIPGNHDERITKPNLLSTGQLARLNVLYNDRNATRLQDLLGFNEYGVEWDGISDSINWFDKFIGVHGLSLAKNAPERNIQQYWGSGASGHTHRLQSKYVTNRETSHAWLEIGCGRLKTAVEYFPTGIVPDWQHGFGTVSFWRDNGKVRFYAQAIPIVENTCFYNGVRYDGNSI
jgi:predicted phosphodiesterase